MIMADIPSTLREQVDDIEEREISYRTLHPSYRLTNLQDQSVIELPYRSITNRFKTYLLACLVRFQLTEEEQEDYRFQPKKLSQDLYGTTELWADLLKLNNAVSVTDFKPDYVTVYDPHKFKEYLNEIMMMDEDCNY